jgi:hypothetical protein
MLMGKNTNDYMAIGLFFSMGLVLVPARDDHVK